MVDAEIMPLLLKTTQYHMYIPVAAEGPAARQFQHHVGITAMASGAHFFLPTRLLKCSLQGFVSPSEGRDSRHLANEKRNPP